MELKESVRPASQFWPLFFKTNLFLVIVIQIAISMGVGFTLVATGIVAIDSILLFWIVGGLLAVNLTTSILVLVLTTRPIKELITAVVHVADGKTITAPTGSKESKQSGLFDALQTIYDLAAAKSEPKQTVPTVVHPQKEVSIRDALDGTSCGFIAMDKNRKIIYSNKSSPVHTDNEGQKVIDLLFNAGDTLETWLDSCTENSVRDEHVWTRVPDRLPAKEGRRFFDVIASYQKGAAVETVISLIDRTKLYMIDEQDLDFIAFAAHELRGPITVIRGYVDVLNDELSDVLQDDQHELFHRLIVSSNRLSEYINNILNTSRYDARTLKIHLLEDTVASIYEIISDDMEMRAKTQNRMLSVKIPTDLPTVAVDRVSMSEVFSNLIDNAIKYSNEGGNIDVTAVANGDFVDVSFQDYGIGMPPSVVGQLFQKFYRSHRSRETVAGTGIGLYISKAIVESHGGTITVRSEDGRGSVFTVSIPIYSTVADKLKASDNSNEGMISEGNGWIKNHSMYRS